MPATLALRPLSRLPLVLILPASLALGAAALFSPPSEASWGEELHLSSQPQVCAMPLGDAEPVPSVATQASESCAPRP
jgi:hypothetical protein